MTRVSGHYLVSKMPPPPIGARSVRAAAFFVFLLLCFSASRADAYPWMVRHDHPGCVQCHMDPSGGGLLTAYGREEGEAVLPMQWGPQESDDVVARRARFAWGLVDTPDWLLLGGGFRPGLVGVKVDSGAMSVQTVLMQADLRAGVRAGGLRASVSLGIVTVDSSPASITGNVVSREHWLGYALDHDTITVRAGRLNVPFGIRSIEHTFWARQQTRTDINDTQQDGLALAYSTRWLRGEAMGILGNYQISPAARRERGYSAYVEFDPRPWAGVGVSSLVTHADFDLNLHVANTRQAHGVFGRVSPVTPLVLLAEFDALLDAPAGIGATRRWVGLLQADVEPRQGVHLIAAGEALSAGLDTTERSWSGWLGVDWFVWSHVDVRADFIRQGMGAGLIGCRSRRSCCKDTPSYEAASETAREVRAPARGGRGPGPSLRGGSVWRRPGETRISPGHRQAPVRQRGSGLQRLSSGRQDRRHHSGDALRAGAAGARVHRLRGHAERRAGPDGDRRHGYRR